MSSVKVPAPFPFRVWCREVLSSREYREQMRKKLMSGQLPRALEVMMHHYAWGKPTEFVEITDKREEHSTDDQSMDELVDRAAALALEAKRLQELDKRPTPGNGKPGNGKAN